MTLIFDPVGGCKQRISVVMVSFRTGPALFEAINAVLSDPDIFELIVIDNGNGEINRGKLYELSRPHSHFKLVQGHGNVGFGIGCNYGASLSSGEYVFFLNPDAVIGKGGARALANQGRSLKKPWIVGAALETEEGKEQRGARRLALTPWSAFISFTPLHKLPGLKSLHLENTPKPKQAVPMPVISGASMMMDRESFDQLGGFDEEYFLHVEDVDICKRALGAGGQVYYDPSVKIKHYGSTSKASFNTVEFEKFKGFVLYFWRYSTKTWAKFCLLLMIPAMFVGIMGRAALYTLRDSKHY